MSDAAFPSRPWPSATTAALREAVAKAGAAANPKMVDEIARRERVEAGDVLVMTPGERLRWYREHPDTPPYAEIVAASR